MKNTTRQMLDTFMDAALSAVDPEVAVRRALEGRTVAPTVVVATGKAAPAMARGAAAVLGPIVGIVVSDHEEPVPKGMELIVAGHPVPKETSVEAGRKVLALVSGLSEGDTLLYLISGGTSALLEVPREGISLADVQATTNLLLRSGATIHEVNRIRIGLSIIKGGGLLRAAAPATTRTLAISDVVADDPSLIGSGPTVAWLHADAWLVVEQYELESKLPAAVTALLSESNEGSSPVPDTNYQIIANGASAAQAVVVAAEQFGLRARIATTALEGEARIEAIEAIEHARSEADVDVWVYSGETTVTVTGDGLGGRNQEAALAAAIHLAGSEDVTFLAMGTDGIDGPTRAAGAIVDGTTVMASGAQGLDPAEHLERNDSATWLAAAGAQLLTGPTGTNVGDIWMVSRSS